MTETNTQNHILSGKLRSPQQALQTRHRLIGLTASLLASLMITACSSSSNSSTGVGLISDLQGTDGPPDNGTPPITVDPSGLPCPALPAAATVDESAEGDYSNDRLNPTLITLGPGANQFSAQTGGADSQDYVTIVIGDCDTLDSITLNSYSGQDEIAFLAIQRGNTFTLEPFEAQDARDQMLGFTHFGTLYNGDDLLSLASLGEGAAGFTAPLQADNYTLWLQQFGSVSSYTMTFNVSRVGSRIAQ